MSPFLAPLDRAQKLAFGLLVGAMAFSLLGSVALRLFPALMGLVGAYYVTLVKLPTLTYMVALPVTAVLLYAPGTGWTRTVVLLAIGSVIGGASELLGTTTGLPFGTYVYTAWLGPKMFGHVPLVIPTSWFALSIVSYDFAGRLAGTTLRRALLTAVFMVAWDVSLDPAMSGAFPFWDYPGGGVFFGMPLVNWFGWFVVSFVIGLAYDRVGGGPVTPHPRADLFYAVNCAFPVLLSLIYGMPLAAGVGLVSTVTVLLVVARGSRTPAHVPAAG